MSWEPVMALVSASGFSLSMEYYKVWDFKKKACRMGEC